MNRSVTAGLGERTVAALTATGLVTASLIVGLIFVELSCYIFLPSIGRASANEREFGWGHRMVFFDGAGTIFQNHADIFTYVPHNDIRNQLGFFSNAGYTIEYDYHFHTNNYGLVQDFDVVGGQPSILLLGDSFTEGLGAAPWFRQLATQSDTLPYQLINGGLSGTGFEQWNKLERYLKGENINIKKLIVLFISDDYRRGVWNFSPSELRCLQSPSLCHGNEWCQRLPSVGQLDAAIDKIRKLRDTPQRRFAQRARLVLPPSFFVYDYVRSELFSGVERAKRRTRATITDFISEYGAGNVAFIHLPQRDELNVPSGPGLDERQSIESAGGRLYDGFKLCGLTPADYYSRDAHPNAQGYGKIANCVGKVLRQMATNAP